MSANVPTRSGSSVGRTLATLGLLILIALSSLGCGRRWPNWPATATATAFPTATVTLTPTATASPTPTRTPTPTSSPTATATATPTVAPFAARISLSAPQVMQGRTLRVRVRANRASRVIATLSGRTIAFVLDRAQAGDFVYVAYIGIGALETPGPRTLLTNVRPAEGAPVDLSTPFTVTDGHYPSEVIYFSAGVQDLLDPAVQAAEQRKLAPIWARWTPERLWTGAWRRPWGGPITSSFGTRRSYDGGPITSFHAGVDLDGETGDLMVASAPGIVALAEKLQVRGNTVILDHGAGVLSGYFHLDSIIVHEGQRVAAGDALGRMGATGLATGSHLHWELRLGEVAVEPLEWPTRDWLLEGE